MAINIRDETTDRLIRVLAEVTGESLTEAIGNAVRERLERLRGRTRPNDLLEDLRAIARRCSALPERDSRSADEILDYDRHGL